MSSSSGIRTSTATPIITPTTSSNNHQQQQQNTANPIETDINVILKKFIDDNKDKNIIFMDNVDLSYILTDKNKHNSTNSRLLMINENNCKKLIVLTPDFVLEIPFNLDHLMQPHQRNNDETTDDNNSETPSTHINNNNETMNMNNRKTKSKRKNRSMSESYCDVIKTVTNHFNDKLNVIDEESNNTGGHGRNGGGALVGKHQNNNQKKMRSISESGNTDENSLKIEKFKGILKNSSYSEEDERSLSLSDSKLLESCKKTVRFSEVIRKQLFK